MGRPAPPVPALAFQDDQALLTPGPLRDRLLDQMRRQGARDLRTNVIWGKVRQEGFGAYDQLVNAARQRGLRVQMTLMGTPQYNPNQDQTLSWQRNDPRTWQSFATEVAKHFKGRVGRYSIGNEMQFPTFFAPAQIDTADAARAGGRAYRGVYRAGYRGVKGADPTAQVLLGEMTSTPHARAWLQGVLGGKPLRTSGLAFHPYDQANPQGQNTWDIDTLTDLQATLGRYKRQGRLQTAKGQAAPLYLTEFGYQRGERSDQDRLRAFAEGYAKAKAAGARQLLQYQLTPKTPPPVTTPGRSGTDVYGNAWAQPGQTRPANWVWDTSLGDAAGNLPVINRGLRLPAKQSVRARAARRR